MIAINCKMERSKEKYRNVGQSIETEKLSEAYSEVQGLKGVHFDAFKVSVSGYGPNFGGRYPIQALGRDSKFVNLLIEIRKEFMDGSKELLYCFLTLLFVRVALELILLHFQFLDFASKSVLWIYGQCVYSLFVFFI